MAYTRTLRVYVAVPEAYSPSVRSGGSATLTLDEFPGETFRGTIVRNNNYIDMSSRTLLVEVDIDNPSGRLLTGSYVFVHLKLPNVTHSVTIPASTLIFRKEGLQVALARDGKAQLIPVKINHDYGNSVEIVSGLQPTDAVVADPSDSLVDGAPVGKGDLPVTIPLSLGLSAGVCVGSDAGAPVMTDYKPPFAFTGTVKKALVDVTGEAVEDMAAKMKMYLARQ